MAMPSILEGLITRPAVKEDAERVTAFVNLCSQADRGKNSQTIDDVLRDWSEPGFNLATDSQVIFDENQELIAYAEFFNGSEPYVRNFVFGRVHPQHRGKGVGTYIVRWLENRAREMIVKAPENARIFMSGGTYSKNANAKALLINEGYTHVRSFYTMQIDMTEMPAELPLPEGITVRTAVRGQDEHAVYEAMQAGFADHWGFMPMSYELFAHYVDNQKDFDPSLWFLAMDGDQIAAISLCLPKTPEDLERGWVDDLCVLRPYRRKGLALSLLTHSFREMYRRGIKKVGLGVDTESLTGATRLYEKAGMRPVEQWDRFEKELRPGVELTRRSLD